MDLQQPATKGDVREAIIEAFTSFEARQDARFNDLEARSPALGAGALKWRFASFPPPETPLRYGLSHVSRPPQEARS